MPRGPPVDNAPPAPLRSGGSGGDGGGPGPPAGRVVPPRDDMDWRDRAIRAEALMERVQGELQESKDRNTELRIQNLEAQNRNLYGQACVAEEWNVWFQDQQEKGFLAGYHQETPQQSPRSTPRGTPARGRSTRGRSQSDDEGYISRSSTPQRSRSGFFRRGKMGDRSMTPTRKGGGRSPTPTPSGGVAGRSFADRTDHSTTFGDGHDTMEIIFEETLKVVPGIDNDPDDATPWADNLTFPDLMDLAWTIKRSKGTSMRIGGATAGRVPLAWVTAPGPCPTTRGSGGGQTATTSRSRSPVIGHCVPGPTLSFGLSQVASESCCGMRRWTLKYLLWGTCLYPPGKVGVSWPLPVQH